VLKLKNLYYIAAKTPSGIFKVTIVWKNAELGVGKEDPTLPYKKQLYPDTANWIKMNNTAFLF
jgi:hypothetical protein